MKLFITSIVAIGISAVASAGPTVKDLANSEARKHDADNNGRIEGTELSGLRAAYAKDPKSWLYLFDDNGNKTLEDAEIGKIEFKPKPKPAPPKPGEKKADPKKSDPKKPDSKKPEPKKAPEPTKKK
jgi:hypothetical protein